MAQSEYRLQSSWVVGSQPTKGPNVFTQFIEVDIVSTITAYKASIIAFDEVIELAAFWSKPFRCLRMKISKLLQFFSTYEHNYWSIRNNTLDTESVFFAFALINFY